MPGYLTRHTVDLVNGGLTEFVEILKTLPLEDLSRPTLHKTVIQNKGNMNILPQDHAFVLTKLDEAKRSSFIFLLIFFLFLFFVTQLISFKETISNN